MAEARKLTFEQTFAKCAIPQGVLSALGPCPAEVRVNKAARSMLVTVLHRLEGSPRAGTPPFRRPCSSPPGAPG